MNEPIVEPSLADVFAALEYQDDNGLVTTDTSGGLKDGRLFVWNEIHKKFRMDAAYFHGNVPFVYFKRFESFNNEILWNLHKSLWNYNRAPLLIVVLPQEVRVYNCFAPPPRTPEEFAAGNSPLLNRASWQATELYAFQKELSDCNLREIMSGRFGQFHQELSNRKHRVDTRLLDNLRKVRRCLIDCKEKRNNLPRAVANRLIGRSIFIRYLEDRGVFNSSDREWFGAGRKFHDLLTSKDAKRETYELFRKISFRFNGDLFPVDDEEMREVKNSHLQELGRFLRGQDIASHQMYFWAYDFNCIPIELISAIYETFLDEVRYQTSAFYTLPEIVDFVLSDILPFDTKNSRTRILDPACGSGIFLVEAYRRLVYLQTNSMKKDLAFESLSALLRESIFGIDTDEDAIQVAIFSCYLALLDFLEPKKIWEDVQLPKLRDTNMFVNDFFDETAPFNNQSFDIIVGNPPWQSKLIGLSDNYIKSNPFPIGDNQVAQAFMWRASSLLADEGKVCLLCPSKSILYNRSKTHKKFRNQFFKENQVTKIVDFSTFRRKLFQKSKAPMVAVFFQKISSESYSDGLTYIGLHPSPLSEVLAGVVIYRDDIKRLTYERVVNDPHIWKKVLWGTPRDLALIADLENRFPALGRVREKRDWKIGKGVTIEASGSKKPIDPQLGKLRFVPHDAIHPLYISSSKELKIGHRELHRCRSDGLFFGPQVLVRRGVQDRGFLVAAFLPDGSIFENTVIGISGHPEDANYLKVICACINSSLARYYLFLTCSTWGIERSEIMVQDLKNFPCPFPVENIDLLNESVDLVNDIQQTGSHPQYWRPELDKLVYRMYGLTSFEQQLIDDFVRTSIERHDNISADAFKPPSLDALRLYAQAYTDVFVATTGGDIGLSPSVYKDISSYRAVSFRLTDNSKFEQNQYPNVSLVSGLGNHLTILEQIATERLGQSIYSLKNIKVFNKDEIHIVKPAEQRFWTRSAAYNDADDTISDLLRTSIQQ